MVKKTVKRKQGSVINNVNRAKKYRKDFWEGAGKAGDTDPLMRQAPKGSRRLTQQETTKIYKGNRIFQNIIDIPAEDMTREWIEITAENETILKQLVNKLEELNAQECFEKMAKYERLRGDGFISIGATERQEVDLSEELLPENIKTVDYLHSFSSIKLNNIKVNDDVFDLNYGDIGMYILKGIKGGDDRRVHPSRLLHLSTLKMEDEIFGYSLYEPLYDVLNIFDTALWSVGQILFDYTFKVLKSKDASQMTREEIQEARMLMDHMFRTEALALIEPDEELKKESTAVAGIDSLLDFVWEVFSGSVRMPKSHILGQQAGTISGAQYDSLNYYARIAGIQENFLRPKINRLLKLLLASDEINAGEGFEYYFKFKPLWKLDDKTDADIRKINAEVDKEYIQNGVLTPDEIREKRFNLTGLAGELGFSEDDLKEIDRLINEKRDDATTNKQPLRRKALDMVNNAIKAGKLKKPTICEKCGKEHPQIEAHHTDYNKPLEVKWYCNPCHKQVDGRHK